MVRRTSDARLEEWARLLGASVPEATTDDDARDPPRVAN
jgi:hypothetical protein